VIIDADRLVERRTEWRREGRTVVWTNGCFDLLHVGHVRSLQAAKALGDVLVVGLNDDASVQQLKGEGRPLVPVDERAELLDALRAVDAVVVFHALVPTELVGQIQPDIFCKGEDYRDKDIPEAAIVTAYGGRVEFVPFVRDRSTTRLAERSRLLP
jgi:D-beta-D-heptose 7-phosphate kinase/D-beta-D-heptose 1-phosphate adenosyltransferase